MIRMIMIWMSSFLCFSVFAAENVLTPTLILNHIKVLQASEKGGDELYFDVAVHEIDKKNYYQIPKSPAYISSERLKHVKNLTIFQAPLKLNENVRLTVSLMDKDSTHFNPDDLLGVLSIKLKNNNHKLEAHWSLPNRGSGMESIIGQHGEIKKVEFLQGGARYQLFFSLKH